MPSWTVLVPSASHSRSSGALFGGGPSGRYWFVQQSPTCDALLTLSLLLVKPLGIMGVAIGTAIPIIVVELGLLLPYVLRTLKLPPWGVLAATVGPQILPLAALTLYSLVVETQFDIFRGWSKLIPVTLGGGAVIALAWGVQWGIGRLRMHLAPAPTAG